MDREKAANLANILEDLKFPATKEDIKNHVSSKPPSDVKTDDVVKAVDNLRDNVSYNSVFEVERDAGLVKKTEA